MLANIVKQCLFCLSCICLGFIINIVVFGDEIRDLEATHAGVPSDETVSTPTQFSPNLTLDSWSKQSRRNPYFGSNSKLKFHIRTPKSGQKHLGIIRQLLNQSGYVETKNMSSNWKLLWFHMKSSQHADYFERLKSGQLFNRAPGFPNKIFPLVGHSTIFSNVPQTFVLPREYLALRKVMSEDPKKQFVHRKFNRKSFRILSNLSLVNASITTKESIVQAYVDNPLLIDGHRFDFGVYVLITSVTPLRVYLYETDISLRLCAKPYNGNPTDPDTFVVESRREKHMQKRKHPDFDSLLHERGLNSKEALNRIMERAKLNTTNLWDEVDISIFKMFHLLEPCMTKILSSIRSEGRFFELVRFDFIMQRNGRVTLMELNRSPFLGEQKDPPTRSLHRQVLLATLNLMGVLNQNYAQQFSPSDRMVLQNRCDVKVCSRGKLSRRQVFCAFCKPFITKEMAQMTHEAFLEHQNKLGFRRLIPYPAGSVESAVDLLRELEHTQTRNVLNYKMTLWYLGKCLGNHNWCY